MRFGLASVLVAFAPALVAAQTLPVPADSIVFVQRVDAAGELRGKFVRLDGERVTLRLDGDEVSLPLREVRRIQKEGDGLANGALIGVLVLGIRCALICGQGMSDTSASHSLC